jgi:hypothetical protein
MNDDTQDTVWQGRLFSGNRSSGESPLQGTQSQLILLWFVKATHGIGCFFNCSGLIMQDGFIVKRLSIKLNGTSVKPSPLLSFSNNIEQPEQILKGE